MAPKFSLNEEVNSVARKVRIKKTFADRLVGWKIAKNSDQANLILIVFIVLSFIVIIYLNTSVLNQTSDLPILEPIQ